jgi:hypothetical protein
VNVVNNRVGILFQEVDENSFDLLFFTALPRNAKTFIQGDAHRIKP